MKNELHIEFTSLFDKQRKAAPSEIKKAFIETLNLFLEEPDHPGHRNHQLKENFAGYRSIDITEDWRAIFKEISVGEQKIIRFHMLGTHKQLYG